MSDKEGNKGKDLKGDKMPKVRMTPVNKKVSLPKIAKPKRSKEQVIELANKICEKYSEGIYTIEGVCNNYGVPATTFENWKNSKSKGYVKEVEELYKKAVEDCTTNFDTNLTNAAKASLLRKVKYVEVEEIHTETKIDKHGQPAGSSIKKVKKTMVPTDSSIIFALTNKDPENFKNRHSVDGDIKVKVKLDDMEDWSLEELEAEENRLQAIIDKGKKARKED